MKTTIVTTLVLLTAIGLSACGTHGSAVGTDLGGSGVKFEPLTITGATIQGDLGEVRGFSSDEPLTSGYASRADYARLTIEAKSDDEEWIAMAIMGLEGGLTHPALVPGAVLSFGAGGEVDSIPPLDVNLLGCSGPSVIDLEFDETAEEGEIVVSEGQTATSTRLDFSGTFADPAGRNALHQVSGWVEVEIPR